MTATRDNLDVALPVFRRRGVPFTVFASSGIADGTCELWWLALERIIAENSEIRVDFEGMRETLPAATAAQKNTAYERLGCWLGRELDEHAQRRAIRALAEAAEVDLAALCRSLAMDWDGLRRLDAEPLATIGTHTVGHHAMARMPEAEAREQIVCDMDRHEAELGRRPEFFAYPYGGRQAAGPRDFAIAAELGFKLAVTTRPGQLFSRSPDAPDGAAARVAERSLPEATLRGAAARRCAARALQRFPQAGRRLSLQARTAIMPRRFPPPSARRAPVPRGGGAGSAPR